jgi:ubiquinone/menaquinone biosynthesis C-methylase UbiE
MVLYDSIGQGYAQTRKSDPRITAKLLEILQTTSAKTVADIGAGTGSYALALAQNGYQVLAIEPSATMRSQATSHSLIEWIDGTVERLPLADRSADAAIVMLAFHHFPDAVQALREIHRVVGHGSIVLFTYNPAMIGDFWLTKYFPAFKQDVEATFLPIAQLTKEIQSIRGGIVEVTPFPLPPDLSDSFAAVGWARPELYLDPNIRNGISSFAKFNQATLESGLSQLQEDLRQGQWDREHGYLRQQSQLDAGYCFVHSRL